MMRWLLPLLLIILLCACGQKGDLYLPDRDDANRTDSVAPD